MPATIVLGAQWGDEGKGVRKLQSTEATYAD
jgi:adenylosuccinate synthase